MAVYPAAIKTWVNKSDLVDYMTAAILNADVMDEIIAVETELGTDPAGASATVEARLDAMISDAVYAAGWNGDTTHAPSKNAVYDKIETIGGGTRRMFFQADLAGYTAVGDFRYKSMASGGNAPVTTFYVPAEATSLDKVFLVVVFASTQSAWDIDLESDYGAAGEAYNTHSESDTASTYSVTINEIEVIDITAKVFNSFAPGDYAGLNVENNHASDALFVLGVLIEYTI